MIFLWSQTSRLYRPPRQSSSKRRLKAPASFINWKQLRKSRGKWTRTMTPRSGRSKISWSHKQKSTWKNISSLPRHCCDIRCSWTSSIPHAGGLFASPKGRYNTWLGSDFPQVWMKRGKTCFNFQVTSVYVCFVSPEDQFTNFLIVQPYKLFYHL